MVVNSPVILPLSLVTSFEILFARTATGDRYLRKPGIEGLPFRRQTPVGPYIVDVFCPARRLIVEVDGGQHSFDDDRSRDTERDRWLAANGYRVVRFWNHEVLASIDDVCRAILAASNAPRPPPP